jgi:DNA-binding LacI/PurR family transcriptional regulator/AraC-like DNA-binding protein
MLASIHSGSANKVWPEIWKESEKRRCVLFIFPGGRLSSRGEYEYMRNGIFDLVKTGNFDGTLCWASSLSGFASELEVERFLESNLGMPLVTFGLKIGKHPVVNIDAYSGMKELIYHLLRRHRCKRIAYLGGPRAHSSAEDRFRAYLDALKENGIIYDDRLVVLDNPWTEGRKAIQQLLDKRRLEPGKDFDALCSASDLLSFEAAALLRERGIKIPDDLALGGFNDSDESNLLSPTFTTVHMPFERQAIQALKMLLELFSGKQPKDKILKTSLIVRQSCGCRTKAVQIAGSHSTFPRKAEAQPEKQAAPKSIDKEALLYAASKAAGLSCDESADLIEALIAALLDRLEGNVESPFMENLDKLLDDAIAKERGVGGFQNLLSVLRNRLLPSVADPVQTALLESLLGQGRVLISEAEKRLSTYRIWQERKLDHWLSILSHELLCAKDFDSIVTIAADCLPPLSIREAYFVLSGDDESRRIFLGGFKTGADNSGSTRIYQDRSGSRSFPSAQLLPEDLFPREPGTYAVLPLYFESTSLGYAVLSVGRKDAYVYEEIRTQLSSALRGVVLFEQANEARIRAEKAERMKSQFLAGISGELQEPLGLIREKALKLLERDGMKGKNELRAIAASSARQLELTRNLLEFSLAQVEDFPLNSGLFKPRRLLEELGSRALDTAAQKTWGRIVISAKNLAVIDDLPLLWGDTARLRRVMEIFLDCLFNEAEAEEVILDASMGNSGIKISANARRPSSDSGRRAAERLRSYVLSDSAGLSPENTRISLELAKRIALLHGALLGFGESGEFMSLAIEMPFPSLDSFSRIDHQSNESWGIGVLGGKEPALLHNRYPEKPRISLGIREALSSDLLARNLGLLYIDPENAGPEEAAAAKVLLDEGSLCNLGCIVPESIADSPLFEKGENLGAVLRSFFSAQAAAAVIVAGAQGPETDELRQALGAGTANPRIFRCRSPEELAFIAQREKAALVLSSTGEPAFLACVLETPALHTLPLLWLIETPESLSLSPSLLERPRTLVCNPGRGFADLRANLCRDILSGSKVFLPAPTGAIVMRAIAFLNRRFREHISRWRLSEELNASEDYLSRIFRTQMGITLWDYLNRLRIAYAVELLAGGSDTVAEIASLSGFQDQAYFCRVFKRIQGTTPGAVRKEFKPDVRKVQ